MDNSIILNYLRNEGYGTVSTEYYNFIQVWENWWKNQVKFHNYHDSTGKERKMYTLGMAKRLAEDWSSILFSEKDEIKTKCNAVLQTKANNKFLELQLENMKLYEDLPETLEKGMAMGTAGAVLRIKYAEVTKGANIKANDRTKLDIIYLSAKQIIPLKVEHGRIIDVAFASENIVGDKVEYYIEIHRLIWDNKRKKEKYIITNTYLDENGKEIQKNGIAKGFTVNSNIPLFAIFKPAIANPLEIDYKTNGMGYSVYGNAIDQLQSTDITFNNFVMDFYLGGKKVFYNKKIVQTQSKTISQQDGTVIEKEVQQYPDDIMRQQWVTYGDQQKSLKDDPAVTEYNPELRVTEDKEGIQFALDLLSFKAGLGAKYYKFDNGSVVTATQYVGDKQDLVENANKHRKNVNTFVKDICKGILLLGRILFHKDVTEDCNIEVVDKDGFMVDTETAKAEFRQDIAQGIRQAWEYRVKFLGEDEETAKARVNGEEIGNIEEIKKDDKKTNENKEQQKNEEEE